MSTAAAAATAPAAPAVEMVNVQVDGVWMKFPKGMRMIKALESVGKHVPHYCYHPKLSSPGNCRMCLVEMGMPARPAPGQTEAEKDEHGFTKIQWMPRAAIACANTVAEGMGIRTEGKLTETCREGVMEFLLINHPLDCPICDQAGECRLQEFSVEHGRGESRFQDEKVKKPKNQDIGERIVLDDERCIMCSRCIRFTSEIAEDNVLGFTERGSYTVLTTHPGKRLDHNYSLNTVDICPVGALTSKDFRFQMRVWFLKETNSICTGCARGCNIEIGAREGVLYRQTPRANDAVNSHWMCDHGRLDFHWVNSDRRLLDPMIKGETGLHSVVGWKEAIQAAAIKLQSLKGDQLAIIASGRMTNEELFMLRRLAVSLGVSQVDIVPRTGEADDFLVHQDRNPNTNGAKLILTDTPGQGLAQIKAGIASGNIRGLLVWRENALNAGLTAEELATLDVLVHSHVMANETAKVSHVVLPGAAYAEKRGSMVNATGRLQRLNQAVVPPGQARDDWEILRDLTMAVGGGNSLYLIEDVFKAMAADITEFAGLNLGKIGDHGVDVVTTGEEVPLLKKEADRRAKGIIVG